MKHKARWVVAEYAATVRLEWDELAHHVSTAYDARPRSAVSADLQEMKHNYNAVVSKRRKKIHTCNTMRAMHVCPYTKAERYLCYGGEIDDIEDLVPCDVTIFRSHNGSRLA